MLKKELTDKQKNIAKIAKALSHPVRVAILEMLAEQDVCYHGDMSEVLPVAKSTLSQHLKELKKAGLICGTTTHPTVEYCIDTQNWKLAKIMLNSIFVELKNGSNIP